MLPRDGRGTLAEEWPVSAGLQHDQARRGRVGALPLRDSGQQPAPRESRIPRRPGLASDHCRVPRRVERRSLDRVQSRLAAESAPTRISSPSSSGAGLWLRAVIARTCIPNQHSGRAPMGDFDATRLR
jgi:hypothetical protein